MNRFINFLFVLTIILMCSIPVCAASNKQYVISSFSYQSANGKRITYKILYNKSGLIDKIQTDYGLFNFTYENGVYSKIELTEYEFPSVYNYTIKNDRIIKAVYTKKGSASKGIYSYKYQNGQVSEKNYSGDDKEGYYKKSRYLYKYTYDNNGNMIKYTYDGKRTDKDNKVTEYSGYRKYEYDKFGFLIKERVGSEGVSDEHATTYKNTVKNGRLKKVVSSSGVKYWFTYKKVQVDKKLLKKINEQQKYYTQNLLYTGIYYY